MWTLNRAAAALVGTFAVNLCAAIMWTLCYRLSCGGECDASPFDDLLWTFAASGLWGAPVAAVAGFAALTITPARQAPWRALPILIVASVIGVILGFMLVYFAPKKWGSVWELYALPCVLGFTAAARIRRLRPLLRV